MRQVLLATYNYYPYNWGGSEVYVRGLAKYLTAKGNTVRILAAIPESALGDCETVYTDSYLRIGLYKFEGIEIIGCVNSLSTEEIYSRYNVEWKKSWINFFKKYWTFPPIDLLHMHANTALIGAALSEAIKSFFPNAKTLFSYHVADTCPKGTLMYFNKSTCTVTPSVETCTACMMNDRWHISPNLAKLLAKVWPDRYLPNYVPAKLRPKYLTNLSLESFYRFEKNIDHWHVFSPQIETALNKLDVLSKNISILRHGIDDHYFTEINGRQAEYERTNSTLIFMFIGRFKKIKGLSTLLNTWMGLDEKDDRKLWVIGSGDGLEKSLNKLIDKSKLRNDVEYFGFMNVKELRYKLSQAHCLMIPSEVVETGPLVFHEAMACGTNVIASDMGGCASLATFYGEGCHSFQTGNAEKLRKKIKGFKFLPIEKRVMSQQAHYSFLLKEYDDLLTGKSCTKAVA